MIRPEVLALMDAATRAGTARDRQDGRRIAHWTAAADVFRNHLARRIELEVAR